LLKSVLTRLAPALVLPLILATASATPAAAYGPATWQATFNGTATAPGTQNGFGFWGWCDFAGGTWSGNKGDCVFAQYIHSPQGSVTCNVNLDLSSWNTSGGDFHGTGTAVVHPSSLTDPCVALFPGSTHFSNVDLGIPAAPGQYHLGAFFGGVGEFNLTVTKIG